MNKFDAELLAKALNDRRVEFGLDLRDVAKHINVSASTLSRIERLGTPDLNTFITLCEYLDCNPSDFITNDEKERYKKICRIDDEIQKLRIEREKVLRS